MEILIYIFIGFVVFAFGLFFLGFVLDWIGSLLDIGLSMVEPMDDWEKDEKRRKKFDNQDKAFVKKIEAHIEAKEEEIFQTILDRSNKYKKSAYMSSQGKTDDSRFTHDLFIGALTGNMIDAYQIMNLCRSYNVDFDENWELQERIQKTSFDDVSDKVIKNLFNLFEMQLKDHNFSKAGFPNYDAPILNLFFYQHNEYLGHFKKLLVNKSKIFSYLEKNLNNKDKIKNSLEKARKAEIKKSETNLNKARSKEKITAGNADTYLLLAELYLYDNDPIEKSKAKSIISEFIETANKSKQTPKMKEAISKAEELLAKRIG